VAASGRLRPQTSIVHTIDAHADTTGAIVLDSTGWGYLAWDRPNGSLADKVLFCKLPPGGTCTGSVQLKLPGTDSSADAIVQPFPVLGGKTGVVYVVGPRYAQGDTVVWSSDDGGLVFSRLDIPSPSYAGNTTVDDVLRAPASPSSSKDYFSVASSNVGLGYSYTGPGAVGAAHPPASFSFGASGVVGATLGISGSEVIEAYWNDADTPRVYAYWASSSSDAMASQWKGPIDVGAGINARLAGGPGGLYLLTQVVDSSGAAKLDLRKWDASTHVFGAPTVVVSDSSSAASTDPGGLTVDVASGAVYVAWPGIDTTTGDTVMRLWTSANGGASFSAPVVVADVSSGYDGAARLAMDKGHGFVTFTDSVGLHLVSVNLVEKTPSSPARHPGISLQGRAAA
jgi:hypothetical protein